MATTKRSDAITGHSDAMSCQSRTMALTYERGSHKPIPPFTDPPFTSPPIAGPPIAGPPIAGPPVTVPPVTVPAATDRRVKGELVQGPPTSLTDKQESALELALQSLTIGDDSSPGEATDRLSQHIAKDRDVPTVSLPTHLAKHFKSHVWAHLCSDTTFSRSRKTLLSLPESNYSLPRGVLPERSSQHRSVGQCGLPKRVPRETTSAGAGRVAVLPSTTTPSISTMVEVAEHGPKHEHKHDHNHDENKETDDCLREQDRKDPATRKICTHHSSTVDECVLPYDVPRIEGSILFDLEHGRVGLIRRALSGLFGRLSAGRDFGRDKQCGGLNELSMKVGLISLLDTATRACGIRDHRLISEFEVFSSLNQDRKATGYIDVFLRAPSALFLFELKYIPLLTVIPSVPKETPREQFEAHMAKFARDLQRCTMKGLERVSVLPFGESQGIPLAAFAQRAHECQTLSYLTRLAAYSPEQFMHSGAVVSSAVAITVVMVAGNSYWLLDKKRVKLVSDRIMLS